MKQSEARKTVIVLITLIGIAAVLLILFGEMTPPARQNLERMATIKKALLSYAEENGKLPEDLSELELKPDVEKDVYGGKFHMKKDGNRITLTSYGANKTEGGIGFNRDSSRTFLAQQPDGSWSDPDLPWD